MNGYSPFSYQIFPPEYFEKKALKKTALFTGLLFVLYLASSLFVGTFSLMLPGILKMDVTTVAGAEAAEQLANMVSYILTIITPFGIYMLCTRIPVRVAFPLRRPRLSLALPAIPLTLGASVIGIIIASVLMTMFASLGLDYDLSSATLPVPTTPVAQVLYLICISVLPAIFEEFAFRGVLMQSLRRHGDMVALVVSSIVFSLFHGNFMQIPNTFILGMIMGFFALRTDSLITSMLMHFFNNFLVSVFDMFVLSGADEIQYALGTLALLGFYVIIGALALVYFLVKQKHIFKLFPSYTYLSTGKKITAILTHPMMIVGMALMLLLCLAFFKPL